MKRLTKSEMDQLVEIDPNAYDRVAAHFHIPVWQLKNLLMQGAVWVVSDEDWNSFTNAELN